MNFDGIVNNARSRLDINVSDGPSDDHRKLLDLLRRLKQVASDALTDKTEEMKQADRIYHAFRVPDDEDEKSSEKGEPIKIIYPVTYAQIQTTAASLMAIYNQKPFFPLEGRQPQSYRSSKLMELELDYQLEQAGWTLLFYSWIIDMLKYGFGCLHTGWRQEKTYITQQRQIPVIGGLLEMMGMPGTQQVTEPVIGYEGADFDLNDPYSFMFDPSVSVGEIQKGQFVFNTWRRSYNELKNMAEDERFFNLEKIPVRAVTFKDKTAVRERDQLGEDAKAAITHGKNVVKGSDMVWLDTCYVKLVPSDYGLSEFDKMQIWKITLANDATIVQAEPSRHEHGLFPVSIIEYNPDRHELCNDGMAQVIDGMQNLINWLLNTHMDSVKKVINDQLIIDPSAIEIDDLNARKPVIRLKPTAKAGIDRYIKQLAVTDVTQGHMTDAEVVFQILQRTTGVNDNSMGVETSSVRTATEVQSLKQNASGRMNLLAMLMWDQGLRPLGKQMIQNTQQFAQMERRFKVTGGLALALGINPMQHQQGLSVTPSDLQGFFSISMIQAVSPQERMLVANQLKEILAGVMQAPQLIPLLGLNISQMFTQMLLGYNIRNTTDFVNPPAPDQNSMMLAMLTQQLTASKNGTAAPGVQAQVMPDAHVMEQVQRGNLVPIETGGAGTSGQI